MLGMDMPSLPSIDPGKGRLVTQPEAARASEPARVGRHGRVLRVGQHR